MKFDGVKFLLSQVGAIEFFNEKYPKSEYKVAYNWNPFHLNWMGFSLIKKQQEKHNPFTDEGLDSNLYKEIKKKYPYFKFEEQMGRKKSFDPEYLLQFLIKLGYEYPEDRYLRELQNPFTGEKLEILYDENNKPYAIKNSKGDILEKKNG